MSVLKFQYNVVNLAKVSDAVTVAGLSTVASGAWSAPSSLIDNTPGNGYGLSYTRGLLRLSFSGPLTAGSGAPYVTAVMIKAADGSTLANPPGTSAAPPSPNAYQVVRQLVAGAAFQVVDFPEIDLDPDHYAVQLCNGSGVAFSGSATLVLYRWALQQA